MNTPTPLQVEYLGSEPIITTSDEPIAKLFKHPDAPERAAEIVRAVNYHDRLVDMVEQLRADLKAARSALYIVGRLQEAQINSKSIQYSEQLLTEIKESK